MTDFAQTYGCYPGLCNPLMYNGYFFFSIAI